MLLATLLSGLLPWDCKKSHAILHESHVIASPQQGSVESHHNWSLGATAAGEGLKRERQWSHISLPPLLKLLPPTYAYIQTHMPWNARLLQARNLEHSLSNFATLCKISLVPNGTIWLQKTNWISEWTILWSLLSGWNWVALPNSPDNSALAQPMQILILL